MDNNTTSITNKGYLDPEKNPYITVDSTWLEPPGPEEVTPDPESYFDTEDWYMSRTWDVIQELDQTFKELDRCKNLDRLSWEERDPMRIYGEKIKPLITRLESCISSLEQKKKLWDEIQARYDSEE